MGAERARRRRVEPDQAAAQPHLVPGEGAIDFAATLQAVRDIGYQGWITIELYPYIDDPDAAARTALQRISKLVNEL